MKSVVRIIDTQMNCLWECLPMKRVARIIDNFEKNVLYIE